MPIGLIIVHIEFVKKCLSHVSLLNLRVANYICPCLYTFGRQMFRMTQYIEDCSALLYTWNNMSHRVQEQVFYCGVKANLLDDIVYFWTFLIEISHKFGDFPENAGLFMTRHRPSPMITFLLWVIMYYCF